MKIINIIAIAADILSILSTWVFNTDGSIIVKIVISAISVIIAVLLVVFWNSGNEVKVIDYFKDKESLTLFIPKNGLFTNDSLVSIYHKDIKDKPIAIGYVLESNQNALQISIYRECDHDKLFDISASRANYKKYLVKPVISHTELGKLNLVVREGEK